MDMNTTTYATTPTRYTTGPRGESRPIVDTHATDPLTPPTPDVATAPAAPSVFAAARHLLAGTWR